MIRRSDLAHLPTGESAPIDGVPMVHLGGGLFQPAVIGEPMFKRFDSSEGEPLHRLVA